MKWFRKLLAIDEVPTQQESADENEQVLAPLAEGDWVAFEQRLGAHLSSQIERFAREHPDETFYSVALDCNATYCNVLLCANTLDALRERAEYYIRSGMSGSVEAEMDVLRWGFGDWKYHGFNVASPEAFERFRELLPSGDELYEPEACERFLEAACRALLSLERNGALLALKRTDDFALVCVEHDEDTSSGNQRLARVRVPAP